MNKQYYTIKRTLGDVAYLTHAGTTVLTIKRSGSEELLDSAFENPFDFDEDNFEEENIPADYPVFYLPLEWVEKKVGMPSRALRIHLASMYKSDSTSLYRLARRARYVTFMGSERGQMQNLLTDASPFQDSNLSSKELLTLPLAHMVKFLRRLPNKDHRDSVASVASWMTGLIDSLSDTRLEYRVIDQRQVIANQRKLIRKQEEQMITFRSELDSITARFEEFVSKNS